MSYEWWAHARDWRSDVWLDGVDVGDRCQAVLMRGEQPIAVELQVRRGGQLVFLGDDLVTEIHCGQIRVYGLRRRNGDE